MTLNGRPGLRLRAGSDNTGIHHPVVAAMETCEYNHPTPVGMGHMTTELVCAIVNKEMYYACKL